MDNQAHTPQPGGPSDSVDQPQQSEPAADAAYPVSAAQAARESRMTEPVVATDGQLVEAGYGHGV